MFGRRNKPDGFEWHKYIRTTVRLRREQRRERVREARHAAAQQANAAGNRYSYCYQTGPGHYSLYLAD